MEILRVHVPSLGPLRGVELGLEPGLNVVYGPNEAGKTTLLDFLLSHLFRWERRAGTRLSTVLGELDRFGDPSAAGGSVELRLEGEVRDYPGSGPSLLHHLGLEHAGLAGLFCVRSGELELPEKDPGDFLAELKKVLSGLPEGVETLRKQAHEAAGLTATTAELSDSGSPGLRTEHRRLDERITELRELTDRLEEVSDLARRVADAERRRQRLLAARRRRIAELERERRSVEARLEETPEPPAGTLERWEEATSGLAHLEEELRARRKAVESAGEELRARREAAESGGREAEGLRERLDRARDLELEKRARRLAGTTPAGLAGTAERLADLLHWTGTALLVGGVGFTFFTPSEVLGRPAWILSLAAALVAGSGLLWAGRRGRRAREERRGKRARLGEDAAGCDLDPDPPGRLPERIARLGARTHEADRRAVDARARADAARERLAERREAVAEAEGRREALEEEIARLSGASGLDSLEEARESAAARARLGERRRDLVARLEGLAGSDRAAWSVDAPPEADLPAWDADAKAEIDRELEEFRERYRELRRAFDRAGLDAPEDVLTELDRCRRRKEAIELDRDAGRLAGEIFGSMDRALEERLAAALEREGSLSAGEIARLVTERYVAVRRTGEGLEVTDREGRSRPLSRLSRGTRDQIYLALRVGLARAALEAAGLGEEGGFLLLDDAFLTADWSRRERLVETGGRLAEKGWQVVYLTCDDHLRDLFTAAGAVLHEL